MNSPRPHRPPAPALVEEAVTRAVVDSAAVYDRLRDAVAEAEVVAEAGEMAGVLLVDQLEAAGAVDVRVEPVEPLGEELVVLGVQGEEHVRLAGPETLLPALGRRGAGIAEVGGAGGHPLAEVVREARQHVCGDSQRLQAGIGERGVERAVGAVLAPGGRRGHLVGEPRDEAPALLRIGDVEEDVHPGRIGVAADHVPLDVGDLDLRRPVPALGQRHVRSVRQVEVEAVMLGAGQANVSQKVRCSSSASMAWAATANSTRRRFSSRPARISGTEASGKVLRKRLFGRRLWFR